MSRECGSNFVINLHSSILHPVFSLVHFSTVKNSIILISIILIVVATLLPTDSMTVADHRFIRHQLFKLIKHKNRVLLLSIG